jgi:hypothetical protein
MRGASGGSDGTGRRALNHSVRPRFATQLSNESVLANALRAADRRVEQVVAPRSDFLLLDLVRHKFVRCAADVAASPFEIAHARSPFDPAPRPPLANQECARSYDAAP